MPAKYDRLPKYAFYPHDKCQLKVMTSFWVNGIFLSPRCIHKEIADMYYAYPLQKYYC